MKFKLSFGRSPAILKLSIDLLDNASTIEKVKTSALSGPRDYKIIGILGDLTSLVSFESETASGTMGGGQEDIGYVYALVPTGVAKSYLNFHSHSHPQSTTIAISIACFCCCWPTPSWCSRRRAVPTSSPFSTAPRLKAPPLPQHPEGNTIRWGGMTSRRFPIFARSKLLCVRYHNKCSVFGGNGRTMNKNKPHINRRPVKSPLENVRSMFFLQKSVLMGLNFIPQKFRVVIGSSCRRFLQPKSARLCYKVLGAKT